VRAGVTIGLTVILAALAAPAAAQDPARTAISGGYAFLRESGTGGNPAVTYRKGWVASISHTAGTRLLIVGEIGGSYRTTLAIETHSLYGFFGGLRYTLTHGSRLTTFAQALVGMERFTAPGFAEAGLAFQPGGGVDITIRKRCGLRVQGDFRLAHEEVNFKEGRVSASVVLNFAR
jgi:hypothetical protein